MFRVAYQFRLAPTKGQVRLLEQVLETCRWLYNDTLAYRKAAWENEQRTADFYETKRRIPILKAERPSLKAVHSQVLQNVTERVDLAFKAFFRRVKVGGLGIRAFAGGVGTTASPIRKLMRSALTGSGLTCRKSGACR